MANLLTNEILCAYKNRHTQHIIHSPKAKLSAEQEHWGIILDVTKAFDAIDRQNYGGFYTQQA